jgi:hypothetical protein
MKYNFTKKSLIIGTSAVILSLFIGGNPFGVASFLFGLLFIALGIINFFKNKKIKRRWLFIVAGVIFITLANLWEQNTDFATNGEVNNVAVLVYQLLIASGAISITSYFSSKKNEANNNKDESKTKNAELVNKDRNSSHNQHDEHKIFLIKAGFKDANGFDLSNKNMYKMEVRQLEKYYKLGLRVLNKK